MSWSAPRDERLCGLQTQPADASEWRGDHRLDSFTEEERSYDSLEGSSSELPDVFEEEEEEVFEPRREQCLPSEETLRRCVAEQLENYLSDSWLSQDAFLLKHIQRSRMGYVSLKLLTSFKKIKELTADWRMTLAAARSSAHLDVNQEGTKVCRREPIPDWLRAEPTSRLLLAWNLLPSNVSRGNEEEDDQATSQVLETAMRVFGCHGSVVSLRVLRPGRELPEELRRRRRRRLARRRRQQEEEEEEVLGKRLCVVVEYEDLKEARKAYRALKGGEGGGVQIAMLGGARSESQESEEGVCEGVCIRACDQGHAPRHPPKPRKKPRNRQGNRLEDSAIFSSSESDITSSSSDITSSFYDIPPASPHPQQLYGSPLSSPLPSSLPPSIRPYCNPAASPPTFPLLPCKLFLSSGHDLSPLATSNFPLNHTPSPLAASPFSLSPSSPGGSGNYRSQDAIGQMTGSEVARSVWVRARSTRRGQAQAFFPEKSASASQPRSASDGSGFKPGSGTRCGLSVSSGLHHSAGLAPPPLHQRLRVGVLRQPFGPDGTRGFYNRLGRGRILLQMEGC